VRLRGLAAYHRTFVVVRMGVGRMRLGFPACDRRSVFRGVGVRFARLQRLAACDRRSVFGGV